MCVPHVTAPMIAAAATMRAVDDAIRAPSRPAISRRSNHNCTDALMSAVIEVPSARPR